MANARVYRGGRTIKEKRFRKGASIHDMVMSFNPETKNWELPTICLLNNAPVLRKDWGKLRPANTDLIEFITLPLGGSLGSFFAVIAMVALAVVANFAGAALAASLGWGATGAMALTMGIMVGGSLLLGSLFKTNTPRAGNADGESSSYSIEAANNLSRLYEPEPEGFGRMKITPDRVTNAWSIYLGNEQYIHQVFALGRGRYSVEQMMFGDNVFWTSASGNVGTYAVEHAFYEAGQTVTLFPDNVEASSEVANQQMYKGQWIGPYSVNPSGTNANRIVCNVTLPAGVGRHNSDGKLRPINVGFTFQIRRIDDYGNPLTDWYNWVSQVFAWGQTTSIRLSFDAGVTEGRYQIRGYRHPTSESREFGDAYWETMYAFLPGSLSYGQSVVAVRTRATNTLSSSAASQFKVIYTRILPEWNRATKTWGTPKVTRSFAAALSQVLRANYGAKLTDDRIDLDTLWAIDEELKAKDWTFDGYFDTYYTIWNLVTEMCTPFGVIPRITGGKITFAQDKADRPVRHIFTPENIVRGSFNTTFHTFTEESPDDVCIEYRDQDAAFQTREVQATLPDSESANPASRTFIGVVKRAQAFWIGVKLAANNRHRRLEFQWQTEAIGRVLAIGDVAVLKHPRLAKILTGTLAGWEESSLSFDLGRTITKPGGQDFWLALDLTDGRAWGPCKIDSIDGSIVKLDAADYTAVATQMANLTGRSGNPFESVSNGHTGFASVWNIETGKEYENRVIINAINIVDRFHYEITAFNDHPDAYGYQDLAVPPWLYRDHLPSGTALTAPTGFVATISGEEESPILNLTWLPVAGADSYIVQYSVDNSSWSRMADSYINQTTFSVFPGNIYIRIAATNTNSQGPWGYWNGSTSALFTPTTPFVLTSAYQGAMLEVEWTPVYNPTNFKVVIHPAQSDSPVRIVDLGTATSFIYNSAMAVADGGPWRDLNVSLITTYSNGQERTYTALIEDYTPPFISKVNISVGTNSISFDSIEIEYTDTDFTGYVIVRGDRDEFDFDEALEFKPVGALPFVWDGLAPGDYYFRIAAKDSFFDLATDFTNLKYSDTITVRVS